MSDKRNEMLKDERFLYVLLKIEYSTGKWLAMGVGVFYEMEILQTRLAWQRIDTIMVSKDHYKAMAEEGMIKLD